MKTAVSIFKYSPVGVSLCWLWVHAGEAATLLVGGFGVGVVIGLWVGLRIGKWRAA